MNNIYLTEGAQRCFNNEEALVFTVNVDTTIKNKHKRAAQALPSPSQREGNLRSAGKVHPLEVRHSPYS